MTKGKSHCRRARTNMVRSTVANQRRKARQQARTYDKRQYDKPQQETPLS